MSQADEPITPSFSSPTADGIAFIPASIQRFATGNVSKATLLTRLLPLSFFSLFCTLVIAARHFPTQYDWRTEVISHLISPRYNPDGYWISAIGMAVSAVLALPFAGYVAQRLSGIAPRMSRWFGMAMGLGIFLVISVPLPLNVPSLPPVVRIMHEALARTAGVCILGGMIFCSLCGMKDRLSRFGGRQSLKPLLVATWAAITLFPIVCGALAGILRLGRLAKLEWAMQLRLHLKQTVIWQLAFWEWVGIAAFILFMIVSVMLLPEQEKATRE